MEPNRTFGEVTSRRNCGTNAVCGEGVFPSSGGSSAAKLDEKFQILLQKKRKAVSIYVGKIDSRTFRSATENTRSRHRRNALHWTLELIERWRSISLR